MCAAAFPIEAVLALQVVLQAHRRDHTQFGFQEIDVLLGILQNVADQIARDVILALLGERDQGKHRFTPALFCGEIGG